MNMRLGAIGLALCGGLAAFAVSGNAQAGNIGYYNSNCLVAPGSKVSAITNAGHTAVAVGSISAATLAPLDALIVDSCLGYIANADIAAAVDDGMALIVNDSLPNGTTAGKLPGSPAITFTFSLGVNLNLAADTPIATGPGGTLTNTSLDTSLLPTYDGYTATSLPAWVTPLLTTTNAGRRVALTYRQGDGLVVYNAMPLGNFLPGGIHHITNACSLTNACAGMQTYLTNVLAWSLEQLKSCEKEGYTGTKLTWCQNICEKGKTGSDLDIWIHRWINKFRDLPYCMQEPTTPPTQPQG